MPNNNSIDELPDEILEYILSLIPPYQNLQQCLTVSKRWFRATKNVIEHNELYFERCVALGSLLWGWSPLASTSQTQIIGKRHSHSACVCDNSMYVFGGCTAVCTTFNDLWKLDLDTRKWVRPITMGSYPSPKAVASMLCHKKNLILFGGLSYPSAYPVYQQLKLFNELHIYSIKSNRWSSINTSDGPPPISAHSATIHKNLMIVFGGLTEGNVSNNDIWSLDLESYRWFKHTTGEVKPQPRFGQSQIALGDNHLLIIGGCTGPNVAMNDVWLLSMNEPLWIWKRVNLRRNEFAPARIWCHQACKVGKHIVILSKKKRICQPNNMSINSGNINYQLNLNSMSSLDRRKTLTLAIDRDENVNGRRGTLQQRNVNAPPAIPPDLRMVNFQSKPSGSIQIPRKPMTRAPPDFNQDLKNRNIQLRGVESTLAIHILDTEGVLSHECFATWIPHKQSRQRGPDERILYSLVLGKKELILFGGIRKEKNTTQGHTETDDSIVFNDLCFVNAPQKVA